MNALRFDLSAPGDRCSREFSRLASPLQGGTGALQWPDLTPNHQNH